MHRAVPDPHLERADGMSAVWSNIFAAVGALARRRRQAVLRAPGGVREAGANRSARMATRAAAPGSRGKPRPQAGDRGAADARHDAVVATVSTTAGSTFSKPMNFRGEAADRPVEQRLGRAALLDATLAHQDHPVAHGERFLPGCG